MIKRSRDHFLGEIRLSRLLYSDRKYYFNLHVPGFPSRINIRNNLGEMNRIMAVRSPYNRLRILFLGITNKCPLKCRHCYEWDVLNRSDKLELQHYKAILSKFLEIGVGQVHFGGGEPMMRYSYLKELTRFVKSSAEPWIATSGIGLSIHKAFELKTHGLTGVAISLDHHEPRIHNDFRGNRNSHSWVMEATNNALKTGLITAWSVCVMKEFLTPGFLKEYAQKASNAGVHYIQVFEPIPTGRLNGQDVALTDQQINLLEQFYLEYNATSVSGREPIIVYHGYHQRRMGCMGHGDRYLYINANGYVHPCPFCRSKDQISALDHTTEELLKCLNDCRSQEYLSHF